MSSIAPSLPPPAPPPASPVRSAAAAGLTFGRMVKFSHTVFAMPFALAAAAIAARDHGITPGRVFAIVIAMIGARTAAMGFNRIVDRDIDARNPRTANRELPTGQVGLKAAVALTVLSIGVFIAAAAWLGPLCLALSPVALALVLGYSYTKRFTWLCHIVLGVAIAAGPGGAWIAVTGQISAPALWLMLAVATWIGGFDVLYSLADRDFDRNEGLHSIPARFGLRGALWISVALHVVTAVALLGLWRSAHLGPLYLGGVALIVLLLIWEHAILRPDDLSRLNKAFFDLNGYVSLAFLAATLADVLL
ncbi:MAG TPA: UbiA-like polyprenyltransferase [Polyangia bacterium]